MQMPAGLNVHHQVHVERQTCHGIESFDNRGANGQIGHKVPVHDINVEQVSASGFNLCDLFAEAGKIGRQDGRCYLNHGFPCSLSLRRKRATKTPSVPHCSGVRSSVPAVAEGQRGCCGSSGSTASSRMCGCSARNCCTTSCVSSGSFEHTLYTSTPCAASHACWACKSLSCVACKATRSEAVLRHLMSG